MKDKLLTAEQAVAVYNAMCNLNNVSGVLHARLLQEGMTVHVAEYLTDEINVWQGDVPDGPVECYADQHDFAQNYGLLE